MSSLFHLVLALLYQIARHPIVLLIVVAATNVGIVLLLINVFGVRGQLRRFGKWVWKGSQTAGNWLYKHCEVALAGFICAAIWGLVAFVLLAPWPFVGRSPAGLLASVVSWAFSNYGLGILIGANVLVMIVLVLWCIQKDRVRRALLAIGQAAIIVFPASWSLAENLAHHAWESIDHVLSFAIRLGIWALTGGVLLGAWIPLPAGYASPIGLVWRGASWLMDNHWRPVLLTLAAVNLLALAVLMAAHLFRARPLTASFRSWLRKWTVKVGRGLTWYFRWSWLAGPKLSARLVSWWRDGSTPPYPSPRQIRFLSLLVLLLPALLLLGLPVVPVNLGGDTAAVSSTSTASSASDSAASTSAEEPSSTPEASPPTPTPTPAEAPPPMPTPTPAEAPPPMPTPTPLEPPPPPPAPTPPEPPKRQGPELAREVISRLKQAEEQAEKAKKVVWGIRYKVPAKYSKEDINEAVELLNQGDFLKKENVPLGYSAQFKDGWIRLAPGGEPDGEIVDFDK